MREPMRVDRDALELRNLALAQGAFDGSARLPPVEDDRLIIENAPLVEHMGVGQLALGPPGFKRYAGHFWGFLETRPYMRARAGLAGTLLKLGDVDSAVAHYRDMLKLNPNDNQGIRYVLAGCLLRHDNDGALKELLAAYEDGNASWLYP